MLTQYYHLPVLSVLQGKRGLPGESGGNVRVIYNEIFNAENWTIVSNGGRGNGGQDGQDGKTGKDGEDATSCKPMEEQFKEIFLPLIKGNNFEDQTTKLNELKETMPSEETKPDIISQGENHFYHKIFTDNGVTITASRCCNHTLILWTGTVGLYIFKCYNNYNQ